MRKAVLTRYETSPHGTFGNIESDTGFSYKTGELPYNPESPVRSCILAGGYICNKRFSVRFNEKLYHVDGLSSSKVDIELYWAQWVGDTSKGFKNNLMGAVGFGQSIIFLEGQRALFGGRSALIMFEHGYQDLDFELLIRWEPGIGPRDLTKLGGTQ